MISIRRYLPLVFAGALCIPFASAQSGGDIAVGFGSAQDKATTGIDSNTLLTCSGGSTCVNTPSLGSLFIGFKANLMLWKHFGVGGGVNIQATKPDYVVLQTASAGVSGLSIQSRMAFYDFNGVYQPYKTKRAALQLIGGIGAAHLSFYENQTQTTSLTGSTNYSQKFGSSNHFQVHGGAGVQINVTDHVFLRPEFQVYEVHNLYQYGRNLVTQESVYLGYSFGGN